MDIKKCNHCKKEKELIEFGNNKNTIDGKQITCKKCFKYIHKLSYNKNKNKYKERIKNNTDRIKNWYHDHIKKQKCSVCDENRWWVLDWHHIESSNKNYNISDMIWKSFSINKIKQELSKCICVCSNCHRDIHYKLRIT